MEEFDKEKSLRKTKINKILAYFLISIGPKLSVEAYKEVNKFLNEDGHLYDFLVKIS